VLPLITHAVSNLFDAHPCLQQEVSRLLHAQPGQKVGRGGTENIFESVPNRVVIRKPADLPGEIGRAPDAIINQVPQLQNIWVGLFRQKLLVLIS
jgi:hypothetical protein